MNIVDTPSVVCFDKEQVNSAFLVERSFSQAAVNRAGDFLSMRVPWPGDRSDWEPLLDEHLAVLGWWRKLHAAPLDVVARTLTGRALQVDPQAIVAQRLKRYRSIRNKLALSPVNNLTTMQDIAGCRAIVQTTEQVYQLLNKYEHSARRRWSASRPELIPKWTKDYLANPKPDGYRSIHLVLKFQSNNPLLSQCEGLRVEIQLRSKIQHAWAMAVETASAVTNQALKSGQGGADWKRFFRIVAGIMASNEDPVTHQVDAEARREAAQLARQLKVISLLENMQHVLETYSSFEGKKELYLLELDSQKREIRYRGYSKDDFQKASADYSQTERNNKDKEDVHIVLVSVESLALLKEAYPSFFLNSAGFLDLIRQQIFR